MDGSSIHSRHQWDLRVRIPLILGDKLSDHGVQRSTKAFRHDVASRMVQTRPNRVIFHPLAQLVNELSIELFSLVTQNWDRMSKPVEELVHE